MYDVLNLWHVVQMHLHGICELGVKSGAAPAGQCEVQPSEVNHTWTLAPIQPLFAA